MLSCAPIRRLLRPPEQPFEIKRHEQQSYKRLATIDLAILGKKIIRKNREARSKN
jgi:hypothetical protein